MENIGERHESAKQYDENDRQRNTVARSTSGGYSPHIQIEEQDGTKTTIRKENKEEYRRKRNKTNNEETSKEHLAEYASDNQSMEGSDRQGEQMTNIRDIRQKTKAVLKCIEIAHMDPTKKAPSNYDKSELYQFVEALERRIVMQLEKNLMLAEQNLCLAEQALFLNNNKAEKQINSYENSERTVEKKLYSEILMKENTNKMQRGAKLPAPSVPTTANHFPSDCVIIIKGNRHDRIITGNELRRYKEKMCRQIGNVLASEIMVIRNTRSGGYIIALKSPEKREEIRNKLINEEITKERLVLPKAKLPKIICRETMDNISEEELIKDLYSWKNNKLHNIPFQERKAKVIQTRLGLVMELSSPEVMAIELQDWKIRYGYGNEVRVEEFIPVQQCYNCSCFGHSANNCNNMPRCRLCASSEHSGRDCNKRNDKMQWKCTNCLDSNQRRNTKFNYNHGAAQLHKCQIAINEREIKKQQLANEGIYVSKGESWRIGMMQKTGETNERGISKRKNQEKDQTRKEENKQKGKGRNQSTEINSRENSLATGGMQEIDYSEEIQNEKILESESDLGNDEEESGKKGKVREVRTLESQRKGFGVISDSAEDVDVDEGWSMQRRGRSRNTLRQRSASRIRRSGAVAKSLHHTRSTTSLGEVLLTYSPIKRKDATRRGRPARSGDVINEEERGGSFTEDIINRRMTPRSEGHGVRAGRIGGYVDRRGVGSYKDSDEVMSIGGDIASGSKGKDRNER